MIIEKINVNDYLVKSNLPSCDYVINPYLGCTHSCKYCYASFMKRFTNHKEDWGEFIDIKICNKEINLKKIDGKNVFLSSVTDCYNEYEEKYELTRKILKQLINSNCNLSISTKSKLILRDVDLLKQIKKLEVAMSINTLDETFREHMDKASTISERLDALKNLHGNGIKTILFMSPIFPYITKWKEIIEISKEYIDEYWFENLNLRGSYKKIILDYIKEKYNNYYNEYIKIYEKKDNTYWEKLSKEIEEYCINNNTKYINYFYHDKNVKNKIKSDKNIS